MDLAEKNASNEASRVETTTINEEVERTNE